MIMTPDAAVLVPHIHALYIHTYPWAVPAHTHTPREPHTHTQYTYAHPEVRLTHILTPRDSHHIPPHAQSSQLSLRRRHVHPQNTPHINLDQSGNYLPTHNE